MENNELNQNNEEKTVNPVEEYVKEIQAKQDKLHGKIDIIYLPPYPQIAANEIENFIYNKVKWYYKKLFL